MQAVVEKPKAEPKGYVMPKVEVGDPVVWSDSVGGTPCVAFVNAVGSEVVNVSILQPDHTAVMTRECRHCSDPMLYKNEYAMGEGCWDYAPVTKRLMELEKALK